MEAGVGRSGKVEMSGRARLPGGAPRKASQRNTRRAGENPARIAPIWKLGDAVRWKGRGGAFRRYIGDDEHAEIALDARVYRVRINELG